ncbi:LRR-domain containing protein [Parasponia andersonii]|uniref:LRR-domain containing protein n=1 Tax=Parasponia andersonii TaxID=3476 RepID=A0A2P5DM93_PARAD|nr:LRR-domain containing protein [Parasponia andersonii]
MLEWREWSFSEAVLLEGGRIFPRLTRLTLGNCPTLNVGLPGYLSSLEDLIIWNCKQMVVLLLRTRPSDTVSSPSLCHVRISDCPALESFMDWRLHSKVKTLHLVASSAARSMGRAVSVAVIGAGVAGLCEGHRVVVYEKGNQVGGTWVYGPRVESDPLSLDPKREIVHVCAAAK